MDNLDPKENKVHTEVNIDTDGGYSQAQKDSLDRLGKSFEPYRVGSWLITSPSTAEWVGVGDDDKQKSETPK